MKHSSPETLEKVRSVCRQFSSKLKLSPFSYACKRVADRIDAAMKNIDERINDKKHECAVVDANKAFVLNNENSIQIAQDKIVILNNFVKQVYKEAGEVEIEPYIIPDFDYEKEGVTSPELLDLLNGFVFELDFDKILKEMGEAKTPKLNVTPLSPINKMNEEEKQLT